MDYEELVNIDMDWKNLDDYVYVEGGGETEEDPNFMRTDKKFKMFGDKYEMSNSGIIKPRRLMPDKEIPLLLNDEQRSWIRNYFESEEENLLFDVYSEKGSLGEVMETKGVEGQVSLELDYGEVKKKLDVLDTSKGVVKPEIYNLLEKYDEADDGVHKVTGINSELFKEILLQNRPRDEEFVNEVEVQYNDIIFEGEYMDLMNS